MSKKFADNCQELMAGMVYWAKTNGIDIDTAVLFVKLAVGEMVKTKFKPGGPVEMYESTESRFSQFMVIPSTTQ